MIIFKVAVIALVSAYCALTVKEHRPEIALIIGLVGGVVILLAVIDYYSDLMVDLVSMIESVGIKSSVVKYLIKIVSVGLITDFVYSTVEESGQKALAEKLAFAGKIVVLTMTIPIIKYAIEVVGSML